MKKLLFVYNPHAGKGLLVTYLSEIIDIFTKGGYLVTSYPTQKKGDGIEIIEQLAESYDFVVCSGGDGTLSETITALMTLEKDKRPNLGYIPAGTTNDFANSMEIPRNFVRAAKNVIEGVPFAYDVGEINGKTFCYVAAFGAFTAVSYETPQTTKNLLGHLAYVLEGIKSLKKIQSYNLKVEYDDGVIEDNFILGMVTNTTSVGGMLNLKSAGVLFDDGMFEVTLVKKPANAIDLNNLLTNTITVNALSNAQYSPKHFYNIKTSKLKITCKDDVSWTVDGEAGGVYNEIEIINHKQAINIIVPNNEEFLEHDESLIEASNSTQIK